MKMLTNIAFSNAKYHKSKNILTGVAIFLTTLLLFLVPTIGLDMINAQKAAINQLYPNWHGLFRNVSEDTVAKLTAHHAIDEYGVRSDLGYSPEDAYENYFMYMDENAFEMSKLSLSEGSLPEAENEIVVSKRFLNKLGVSAEIGDTLSLYYQVNRADGLDYAKEKDFVITGFWEEQVQDEEQTAFTSFVSHKLLQEELSEEELKYRFMFRIASADGMTSDEIEDTINQLAEQFGISEDSVRINDDNLWANYVDPSFVPIIVIIVLVIVLAGVITIYSIYYISVGERVQELGKIKAIGATTYQMKRIILTEGMITAGIAIPIGLLVATILTKSVFMIIMGTYQADNIIIDTVKSLIDEGSISLYIPWVYLLVVAVAIITVILSLLHPMKVASGISEVDAMRYHDETSRKKERKGYINLTIAKLTQIHLSGNKKKSIITICSMAITGVFFMIVATVLSCANPKEAAENSIMCEYKISPHIETGNKEHPEYEWSYVQKNNPLTEELKDMILQIDGIETVECVKGTFAVSDSFGGDREGILGVPESKKKELEKGIIEGSVTYDELKSGDKVIVDNNLLHWYPDLKIGDFIEVFVDNGDEIITEKLEIVAISDYAIGFTDYNYLIMAEEGLDKFINYSNNMYFNIHATKKYDAEVEKEIQTVINGYGDIDMSTWKEHYDDWNSGIALTKVGCFAFLGILGAICIMNMINTMISSVHVRKKEFGMLQAIGMSDSQLFKMLQLESAFYTVGTIIVSVVMGSACGYPIFLWARKTGMFNIRTYHYPVTATVIMVIVLLVVQIMISLVVSRSVRKETIIDRIRFSN